MFRGLLGAALPNLSNSMMVARLRYIQSVHETPDCSNPDGLVVHLLPRLERWRAARLRPEALSRLRSDAFYYFLVARTRYYDEIVSDAISGGVRRIVNVGSGTDTRAHRFAALLRAHDVSVIECDQPAAIDAKRRGVRRWKSGHGIRYLPIDLNDGSWPTLERMLAEQPDVKTLMLLEGVSPYIDEGAFTKFLLLLTAALAPSSRVAYDFKYAGVDDEFGRGGRTVKPFRQSPAHDDIRTFHERLGFQVDQLQASIELTTSRLPAIAQTGVPLFREDGLIRLHIAR
jgi:methyltransferase (TIGR00027 family)